MSEITKAMRFQIVKPLNVEWKEFGAILNDLSYQTTRMCNAAIQQYWQHHNARLNYKSEHGKYPKDKDLGYPTSFRNHVYHILRGIYPSMSSSNVSQTNQFAQNRWKNDIKEIMRLQKSIPSFRLGTPIQISGTNYQLSVVEGKQPEYRARVTLLSQEAEQTRFDILLNAGDKTKKTIFRRIIERTYKQGVMQIFRHRKKRKWFCIVSFTFTPDTPETNKGLDENRTMGINFASGEAVYWAFNCSQKRGSVPADEIAAADAKIAALTAKRKAIQRTADTKGHGRKRRLKATEGLQGKAAEIRKTINHKYSRRIVDIAAANRCGVIKAADMSGAELDRPFKSWPWAGLVDKIKYKAEEKGITVYIADRKQAEYTCSKCGYGNPENIEGNEKFLICKNPDCGVKINMEYNTARNLSVAPI